MSAGVVSLKTSQFKKANMEKKALTFPTFVSMVTMYLLCSACYLLHAGFLFVLFFDHEDGGNMFLQNAGVFQLTTRHYIPEDIANNLKC
jgi:hypothetical protein